MRRLLGAAFFALVTTPEIASAGPAGGNFGNCGDLPPATQCYIEAPDFPGGTVSIDIDVLGAAGGEDLVNRFSRPCAGSGDRGQPSARPPSTRSRWPVTKPASFEAKKLTAAATSSGVPRWPIGTPAR
ncbi:MAG: hypothetical protein QOI78_724 [Actinomycetota bacterium]|nr:hypothetical protein [Actinomycetota bacterium]